MRVEEVTVIGPGPGVAGALEVVSSPSPEETQARIRMDALGKGDAAFGGPGLGGQRGEPACTGALECAADGGSARVEVEVFTVQAEEFALAESGVEGEFEQGVQTVIVRGGEESAGFVGGEGFEAAGPWGAGRTLRATLRGISSSRTACSRADLSTEWM